MSSMIRLHSGSCISSAVARASSARFRQYSAFSGMPTVCGLLRIWVGKVHDAGSTPPRARGGWQLALVARFAARRLPDRPAQERNSLSCIARVRWSCSRQAFEERLRIGNMTSLARVVDTQSATARRYQSVRRCFAGRDILPKHLVRRTAIHWMRRKEKGAEARDCDCRPCTRQERHVKAFSIVMEHSVTRTGDPKKRSACTHDRFRRDRGLSTSVSVPIHAGLGVAQTWAGEAAQTSRLTRCEAQYGAWTLG
jgi:hypothetical protein